MGQIIEDKNLELKFKAMGYESGNEIIHIDNNLSSISKTISKFSCNIDQKHWFCTKRRLIKSAKQVLDNLFDIHDVRFAPENIIHNISFVLESDIIDEDLVLNQLQNISKLKSPYDIPIKYSYDSRTNHKLIDNSIYFYSVSLDKKDTRLIIPEYIHELGHMQLDSQKGVITNYHNREFISIFLEQLSALHLDSTGHLLKNIQLIRLDDLSACIDYLSNNNDSDKRKLEASIFVVSTLKAIKLFEEYMNGDPKSKEKMLLYIQNTFDGKETVEDTLERYNISFENSDSEKAVKRLLRNKVT